MAHYNIVLLTYLLTYPAVLTPSLSISCALTVCKWPLTLTYCWAFCRASLVSSLRLEESFSIRLRQSAIFVKLDSCLWHCAARSSMRPAVSCTSSFCNNKIQQTVKSNLAKAASHPWENHQDTHQQYNVPWVLKNLYTKQDLDPLSRVYTAKPHNNDKLTDSGNYQSQ